MKQLADLIASLIDDADELRRHLNYARLDAIADDIPSRASKTDAAFTTAGRLLQKNSTAQFLTYFLECNEFTGRHRDFLRVASSLGVRLAHSAREPYLRTLVAAATDRQTLAGLRGPAVPLASVYVDPCLQAPHEPDFCGKTMTEWLKLSPAGNAILILGEPGAGKSELLLHSAAQYAHAALEDPSAALPLLVTASELVSAGSLIVALSKRWRESQDDFAALLRFPSPLILFIDSLDEAPARKILELLDTERRALNPRLQTLVLTSRHAFAPTLHACFRVILNPWSPDHFERFLAKWSDQDPTSVTALREYVHEPHVRELLTNPLTATLCITAARRHPNALRRRSLLFKAVFDDVLQWWPTNRSSAAPDLDVYWPKVAPLLRDLATIALRERRAGIDRDELIAHLSLISRDAWRQLLDWIERGLGVLAPIGDDALYRFTDRRLMEYLAAQRLLEHGENLVAASMLPWAHEPVRIAFGLLQAENPARSAQYFDELLVQQSHDVPGLHDTSLRALLVAIDVAADEPDLAMLVPDRLADCVMRYVVEEYSSWVGDVVARSARRLAHTGGPLWIRLEPKLLDVLTNEELRKPFHADSVIPLLPDMYSALQALPHRNAEVRLAACERLRDFIDSFDVQTRLLYMLFDDGDTRTRKLAFTAGWSLRHATRGPAFSPVLKALQNILAMKAQRPSCGAAIALHPCESQTDTLVTALAFGLQGGGEIPLRVFEDLVADPSGSQSLDKLLPDWQEKRVRANFAPRAPLGALARMPDSITCRSRAFEILAASSIPPSILDQVLNVQENLHSYTESLDLLTPTALYALLDRIRETDYDLCAVAQNKLGKLALKDPALASYVLDWWDTIDRDKPSLLESFPGRALEPLVLAGDARAIEVYSKWLPDCEIIRNNPAARHGTKIPREILAVPSIRLAARRAVFDDNKPHPLFNMTEAENLSNLWHEDTETLNRIERWLTNEHEAWRTAVDSAARSSLWTFRLWTVNCRDITLPASMRALLKKIFHDVVHYGHHDGDQADSYPWHYFVSRAIRTAINNELVLDFEDDLRFLAGDGQMTPCAQLGLHAACAAWPFIPEAEHNRISTFWARRFHHALEVNQLSPSDLARVVEANPDAWIQQLREFMDAHSFNAFYPMHALLIFESLPPHTQRDMADSLLAIANRASIPWIRRRFEERRPVRLADDIRRIAFETQVI